MSAQVTPFEVQSDVRQTEATEYVLASTLALLIYDQVICSDVEVKHIWRRPKALITWLYTANRLFALTGAITNLLYYRFDLETSACRSIWVLTNVFGLLSQFTVELIICFRVEALYSDVRRFKYLIRAFTAVAAIASIVLGLHGAKLLRASSVTLDQDVTLCNHVSGVFIEYGVSWVIIMIYELTLMTLAIRKAAKIWKENAGADGFDLVKILIRDQAVYFVAVIFVGIFQAASFANLSAGLSIAFNYIGNPNLLSIPGSRLLLNMRQAGERSVNPGTSCRPATMSGMEFAEIAGGSQLQDEQELSTS